MNIAGLTGANAQAGVLKQLFDFGSSLVNPAKVQRVVGTVAKPIRELPTDVKDSKKTKEENKDKRDATFLEKAFSRITWLHFLGVLGVVGSFVKPLFEKNLGEGEQSGILKKGLDLFFNAFTGIGALLLSEISFNNKWHLGGMQRLEELGVLEKVTGTAKWKELEVEKHIKSGKFPMEVNEATKLLLEVRSSPKHRRATCYEGGQGQGKTLAAYISSYKRVATLKAKGKANIEPLQINAPKLLDVAQEKIAQTAQMGDLLGGKLKEFVSADPLTYANDELERELVKGSVIVNDDAEYQLQAIDKTGFQWLRRISEEHGGSFIITIPRALKDVLNDNKNLQPSDRKTLLQRVDSISFPFENNRMSFDKLDDALQKIISSDIEQSYRKGKEQFHQCYLREQQLAQWKGFINRVLIDDREKFGREKGIGKTLSEYFTDEKLNELISQYPMNPRYIGFTIDSLAILLDNRRNQNVTASQIDFMLKAILECDTFKNYIRSIDYRPSDESARFAVVDTSRQVVRAFRDGLEKNISAGFKESEGKKFTSAKDLIGSVLTAGGIPLEHYAPPQVRISSSCLSRRDANIKLQDLDLYFVPEPGIIDPANKESMYKVVFAVDKNNPNKIYSGYFQEGHEVDTLTLTSVCDKGADVSAVKKWMLETR